MSKFTTFFYRNLDGAGESLELPTVQSINLPDDTSIPAKPTIAGEYRNQYVATGPVRATIVTWLEGGMYGDISLDVSTVLDKLYYLKTNRIRFNITSSHTEEESRFLADMVIENISLNRESSRRDRLIVTLNCTQVKFVNLTWKQASAVEIFGKEIFTSQSDQTLKMDFTAAKVNDDFGLDSGDTGFLGLNAAYNGIKSGAERVVYESGLKNAPVAWQVKKAIENDVQLTSDSFYYKLTDPIDMSVGSRTYNCNCSFQTRYGMGSTGTPYTVDLGQFNIIVNKKDGTLVSDFPASLALGSKTTQLVNSFTSGWSVTLPGIAAAKAAVDVRDKNSTYPYVYDFADTYPNFTISKTFDQVESFDKLAEYLQTAPISSDEKTFPNNVIVKDGYVWSYRIKDRYDYSVGYSGVLKKFVPDGGLRIDKFNISTAANGFKPKISNDQYQDVFDDMFRTSAGVNYTLTVVGITLGTLLQVYLFSPKMFSTSVVTMSTASSLPGVAASAGA